ncbi:MAG: hypothetical protein K9G67_00775 [Bacteroidales bacterium]|nr:hypothetical protein [Bacteroidales bacterium]MCF8343226.1 hypothetical protein [Bacteroidales bacterium]MCF8350871.1 hypothetical protein [Bacteroidales bacterium]MCF8374865.1 hypothetical protein [Bacteroidales bacterium]MCF8399731.1 hypothetical protein [Bacteroidales bacterium]
MDRKGMESKVAQSVGKERPLHGVWLKAATVGGLWAAIEIILGSFLHNMRIPFAGSVLTFMGLSLLISFHRMWPEKGLILRAGIICALMKSISPSSVILGPMSGIFFEALLLEAGIRVLGANRGGYFLGAALGMLSTLIHKVFSLLILYGMDIVTIYKNIYLFLAKQLQLPDANPWTLVWAVVAVYLIVGLFAATLGLSVGNRTARLQKESKEGIGKLEDRDFFEISPDKRFSLWLLALHAIGIPLGLYLINYTPIWIALAWYAIYLGFCVFYYRSSLRRLKKPVFWFQLFMITLLAAVFWRGFNMSKDVFNPEGLRVGLEMNLRAIFIVIAFSSLSVELRNPGIREYLFGKGFGNLYKALGLAFNALPSMMRSMPKPRTFFKNPLMWFARINLQAQNWLLFFEPEKKA